MMAKGVDLFRLDGKKALVTGARGGLGKGMAQALRDAGAVTLIVDCDIEVEKTAEELGAKAFQADLSDIGNLPAVMDRAVKELGGIDILVNNAGILTRCLAKDIEFENWRRVLGLNVDAVFRLCQLAGERMIPQGSGKIINIASMLSYFGGYLVASYAASKGAVAQLTKALSNEWAEYGICVNALAPGYMDTPINATLISDEKRAAGVLARIPMGRWGLPDDLAGAVIFLASHASDYISGAIIPVDGGYLSR